MRAEAAESRDRQSLLFGGTGFVDLPPSRVFVPLVGRPRWVPSQQAELRYRNAFPKVWHCWLFAFICMLLGTTLPKVTALPSALGDAFLPCALAIAIATWCWRRIALVGRWQVVEQSEVSRSRLVLASLESWPVVPLSLTFAALVAIGIWVIPSMQTTTSDGAPPSVWLFVALLAVLAFAYLRAVFWLTIALGRRVRRWIAQELS